MHDLVSRADVESAKFTHTQVSLFNLSGKCARFCTFCSVSRRVNRKRRERERKKIVRLSPRALGPSYVSLSLGYGTVDSCKNYDANGECFLRFTKPRRGIKNGASSSSVHKHAIKNASSA